MSTYVPYSCPHFDAAIASIEEARNINRDLREQRDELETDCDNLIAENRTLSDRVKELEAENAELYTNLESLKAIPF